MWKFTWTQYVSNKIWKLCVNLPFLLASLQHTEYEMVVYYHSMHCKLSQFAVWILWPQRISASESPPFFKFTVIRHKFIDQLMQIAMPMNWMMIWNLSKEIFSPNTMYSLLTFVFASIFSKMSVKAFFSCNALSNFAFQFSIFWAILFVVDELMKCSGLELLKAELSNVKTALTQWWTLTSRTDEIRPTGKIMEIKNTHKNIIIIYELCRKVLNHKYMIRYTPSWNKKKDTRIRSRLSKFTGYQSGVSQKASWVIVWQFMQTYTLS